MLNHIVLIGRLVRDPELRYTSNGTPVSNFTLAVERNYTNRQGETEVDYIKIVTWRKLAENCAHHLGKGRLVAVDGSLHIRKRTSEKDGRTYINPEVVANNVQFLDWPSDTNNRGNDSFDKNADQSDQGSQQGGPDIDSDEDFDVPF
ncbi:MAG: single-stranded DNA-binding protein [Bacillota bacterium]